MPRKIILEKIFDQKITERVKTFKDACDVLGIDEMDLLLYESPKTGEQISTNVYVKLIIICRALNEGWKPNWKDGNEYKHYPYFELKKVGSGFRFSYCGCTDTYMGTAASARLVFKTATLAEYAGKQFVDIYEEFMTL